MGLNIFVYQTETYKNSVKRNKTLQDRVDCIIEDIKREQKVRGFEVFRGGYLVKQKIENNFSLIVKPEIVTVDNTSYEVVVFHLLMAMGDDDYRLVVHDAGGYAKDHFDFNYDLKKFVQDQIAANNVPKPLPELSEYEYSVLYDSYDNDKYGTRGTNSCYSVVYESHEWVKNLIHYPEVLDSYSESLHSNLCDILSSDVEDHKAVVPVTLGSGANAKQFYVVYHNSLENNVFFLEALLATEQEAKDFKMYDEYFENYNEDIFPKCARRSYPEQVLKNYTMWQQIELDKTGNIALSPEEMKILKTAMSADDRAYPLLINGRAGSGKSTILQYLFAAQYFHFLKSETASSPDNLLPGSNDIGNPVYFTYNEDLLAKARDLIDKLFKGHEYFGALPQDESTKLREKKSAFDNHVFKNFRTHLLNLTGKDRYEKFPKGKEMTYKKFMELWNEKFSKDPQISRKISPEVCWHVIRTYIKGNSISSFMDTKSYSCLSNKTVSVENYETIYERIWPWYRSLTLYSDDNRLNAKFSYWDAQDLVKFLLLKNEDGTSRMDEMLNGKRYSAIFCDESQDFTRIELEAIMEMSLFLNRQLEQRDLQKVPILFAGDPFQTLNPTGFSWEVTKRDYVDKVLAFLDNTIKPEEVELNPQELCSNYRSTQNIVKISNTIQLCRAAYLNESEKPSAVIPQESWSNTSESETYFFEYNDDHFWTWANNNRNVFFVLPCEEGQEIEFLKEHEVLWNRFGRPENFETEDSCRFNILSAAGIKGLEYDTVVVCGFGLDDNENGGALKDCLTGKKALDESKRIKLEYFVNRLYVAVTRPTKKMFILDSIDEGGTFWKAWLEPGDKNAWFDKLMQKLTTTTRSYWGLKKDIAFPVYGEKDHLKGTTEGSQYVESARRLFNDGSARRNLLLLQRAVTQFANANYMDDPEYFKAKAWCEYLRKDYVPAAQFFHKAGMYEYALHAYFLATRSNSSAVENVCTYARANNRENLPEYQLVDFLRRMTCSISILIKALEGFIDYESKYYESGIEFAWEEDYAVWSDMFKNALRKQMGAGLSVTKDQYVTLSKLVMKQTLIDFDVDVKFELLYNAGMYEEAKICIQNMDNLTPELAAKKKLCAAYTAVYPENLRLFQSLEKWQEIVDAVAQESELEDEQTALSKLNEDQRSIYFQALSKTTGEKNFEMMWPYFRSWFTFEGWRELVDSKPKDFPSVTRFDLVDLIAEMVDNATEDRYNRNIQLMLQNAIDSGTSDGFNKFCIILLVVGQLHSNGLNYEAIYELLKKTFISDHLEKKHTIDFDVYMKLGRVFRFFAKKAGHDDDAADFYQYVVYNSVQNEEQRRRVEIQWIWSKRDYLKYLKNSRRNHNRRQTAFELERDIKRVEREINDKIRQYSVDESEIGPDAVTESSKNGGNEGLAKEVLCRNSGRIIDVENAPDDLAVIAAWSEASRKVNLKTYKVVFHSFDGSVLNEYDVEEAGSIKPPKPPVRKGFKFEKWDQDTTCVVDDMTVKPIYEEESYTVTFCYEDGSIFERCVCKYGDRPEASNVPKKPPQKRWQYDFVGWSPEVVPVAENCRYLAVFKAVSARSERMMSSNDQEEDDLVENKNVQTSSVEEKVVVEPVPITDSVAEDSIVESVNAEEPVVEEVVVEPAPVAEPVVPEPAVVTAPVEKPVISDVPENRSAQTTHETFSERSSVFPDVFDMECGGYKIKGYVEDDDYKLKVVVAATGMFLCSLSSCGISRKKSLLQKNANGSECYEGCQGFFATYEGDKEEPDSVSLEIGCMKVSVRYK